MATVTGLLFTLAVFAIVGAGFATLAGVSGLRERCFAVAIAFVLAGLALRLVAELVGTRGMTSMNFIGRGAGSTTALSSMAFVAGHLALGIVLLVRQRRGQRPDELEQARGRGRPRLNPDGEEADP